MNTPAQPHTLARQQRLLREAVVSRADESSAADLLRHQPGREPLLRIYQHAYAARLVSALRDNYGVLPLVMGDEAFDELALAYLQAHPSSQPSIRWFGHQLADFMAQHDEHVPHPAFIDLARMEWALRDAFDAPDAVPLDGSALAARPAEDWPDWVPTLHPSVRWLPMAWFVEPAWRALQNSDGDAELPEPEAGEHSLLVWRPQLETRWRAVTEPIETALLNAAADGVSFATLCAVAAEQVGEDAAAIAVVTALQQWIAEGLLVS